MENEYIYEYNLFRENINLRDLNQREASLKQNKDQIKKIGLALFLSPEQININKENNYFENHLPNKYKNFSQGTVKIKSLRNILIILTIVEIFASMMGLGFYLIRRVIKIKYNSI
jgi:hypothetical protein